MRVPLLTTVKRLFALSNNQCAFPGCSNSIDEDSGVVTGKICHTKARSPEGPRYDPNQLDEEMHSFSNLLLLCGRHHDIIDSKPEVYTVVTLHDIKRLHEQQGKNKIGPDDMVFAKILLNDYRKIHISNNKGTIIIDSPGAIKADTVTIKTERKSIKILPPEDT